MPETVERKYALTKLKPGDYLLPSNDGKTIWRIARYTEGPSTGIDSWPRDREVWGIWKWAATERLPYVDTRRWDAWEMVDSMYHTRAQAIAVALYGTKR